MVAASRRNGGNRIRDFHPYCRPKIIWTSARAFPTASASRSDMFTRSRGIRPGRNPSRTALLRRRRARRY
ncbi:DUF1589 domain-containing protein [Bradyrhizobium sp. ISRA442]|uniref:DUF1589 domain-containing protein n=1 Tax=Bradyrhizobium sp. ISRA442 TaxID=2866197 RepID=UPI00404ABBF5